MKKVSAFVICITLLAFAIRIIAVSSIPPGLYIDEVSNGINAYTILTTGRDEYGVPYPLWFKAFGEYKLPTMIYLISGSMAIFGKTEFAVRLPSVLAGTLSIPLFFFLLYLLVQRIKDKKLQLLPYIAAVMLAFTPWHIHFSRGGFEATIALFFTLLGLACFLLYVQKKTPIWLFMMTMSLAITMYTYNAYRLIAIVIFLFIAGYLFIKKHLSRKMLFVNVLFFLVIILPVIIFSVSQEGSARFEQTSLLSSYVEETLQKKVIAIPMDFVSNYLKYYSPEYLFAVGDRNGRHQVPGFGLLYRWESIFFLIGLFYFVKRPKDLLFASTLLLLLIAPVPAALTIPSPHALRSLLLVVPSTILVSLGLIIVYRYMMTKKQVIFIAVFIFSGIAIFELLYFGHLYTSHYPKVNLLDWGAGYKDTILKASSYSDYDAIVIDSNIGNITPYITFYDPTLSYTIVGPGWRKPASLQDQKVLYIRPDYKGTDKKNRIDIVTLPNTNKDIFAEFYSL